MTRPSQVPSYHLHIYRVMAVPDAIRWELRKAWWRPRVGANSRAVMHGVLEGMPDGLREHEALVLALEAVQRRLRELAATVG